MRLELKDEFLDHPKNDLRLAQIRNPFFETVGRMHPYASYRLAQP